LFQILCSERKIPDGWLQALDANNIRIVEGTGGQQGYLSCAGADWELHVNSRTFPIHRQTPADMLGKLVAMLLHQEQELSKAMDQVTRLKGDRKKMARIGAEISSALELETLLPNILNLTMDMTCSDGGSLYLVERIDDVEQLRFKAAENRSIDLPDLGDLTFPLDESSLVGECAVQGKAMRVAKKDISSTSHHDERVDHLLKYKMVNLLMVPLKNQHGEILGVLQLINHKRRNRDRLTVPEDFKRKVIPFSKDDEIVAGLLESQAAVAIEKARLYSEISGLFESFVSASVKAIEQRDPTTAGHSGRVAGYTVSLAEAVDREGYQGYFLTPEKRKMLRYAGLLHDFGKIGVREHVLMKAKKLSPDRENVIRTRTSLLKALAERDHLRRQLKFVIEQGADTYRQKEQILARELDERIRDLDEALVAIVRANQPNILLDDGAAAIRGMTEIRHIDSDGKEVVLLNDEDVEHLSIAKGSLSQAERLEIEGHVLQTIEFMQQIPWPRDLKDMVRITGAHHEKLDGSGYPYGLSAGEICLETRMMTICDIFDALTSSDRPYKKAVSHEVALDILSNEASNGKVDQKVLDIFIAAGVHCQGHSKTTH